MSDLRPVIIGGGPAGISAAHALAERRLPCLLLEKDQQMGGLCKTVKYKGFRCDIGGHRFFTKNKEIQALWEQTLPADFLVRQRLSRIYYRGKFFYYPLRVGNALSGLGPLVSSKIVLSYLKARAFPVKPEVSFADWVSNRFGKILFNIFFKTYTEKVWGISCTTLSADWAAQRIRNLSLGRALINAMGLQNRGKVASLIDSFHYPRLGPGQMYEDMCRRLSSNGGEIRRDQEVVEVRHTQGKVTEVLTRGRGHDQLTSCSHCFSSMPISELVLRMSPRPPEAVLTAARNLRYRSIITVNLLFKTKTTLPDNWIYLHSPEVTAGRLQLYENWSPAMVPRAGTSSAGFEYFCFEGDALWNSADSELINIARQDQSHLKFYNQEDFLDGFVVRYAKAYPMYEDGYEKHLGLIKDWLAQFSNLYCIGRYGQFRYNNMDHSMLTGILAARAMLGENVDPWSVNAEGEYIEEKRAGD
ncbi:MAG: NAD(P)/FAD-dependent oxidoreductase [Deltaproteobacteria bacterium]|nr:NAD(P)/FAD-dependent oxidoreductase [Deltaproteobacteria bacterium]